VSDFSLQQRKRLPIEIRIVGDKRSVRIIAMGWRGAFPVLRPFFYGRDVVLSAESTSPL
jgi:hypothetical protein